MYRQLLGILRAAIADGTYPPGTLLPGTRELAARYELAVGTVRKAVNLLREEGLVRVVPGRGVLVLEPKRKR